MGRVGPAKTHVFTEEQISRAITDYRLKPFYRAQEARIDVLKVGKTNYHRLIASKRLGCTRDGRLLGHTGKQLAVYLLTIEAEGATSSPAVDWRRRRVAAQAPV